MSWQTDAADLMHRDKAAEIKLATMTGERSCEFGAMSLTAVDLYIPDRLLTKICTGVKETAPAGGGQCSDQSSYSGPLKTGDKVLIYQVSDSKFAILDRVVDA